MLDAKQLVLLMIINIHETLYALMLFIDFDKINCDN